MKLEGSQLGVPGGGSLDESLRPTLRRRRRLACCRWACLEGERTEGVEQGNQAGGKRDRRSHRLERKQVVGTAMGDKSPDRPVGA